MGLNPGTPGNEKDPCGIAAGFLVITPTLSNVGAGGVTTTSAGITGGAGDPAGAIESWTSRPMVATGIRVGLADVGGLRRTGFNRVP